MTLTRRHRRTDASTHYTDAQTRAWVAGGDSQLDNVTISDGRPQLKLLNE